MFGSQHEVGGAEKSVGTRRENRDGFLKPFEPKADLGTFAAAYPVALKQFDRFRPVEAVEVGDKAFGISRDAEHPLAHRTAFHREAPHLTLSIHNLLVCEDSPQAGAPVHGNFRDESQTDAVGIGSRVGGDRLSPVGGGI